MEHSTASVIVVCIIGLTMLITQVVHYHLIVDALAETKNIAKSALFKASGEELPSIGRNGAYYHDKFYCVWTKDRDYCDIMEADPSLDCVNVTAFHELTHAMVRQNKQGISHFCDYEVIEINNSHSVIKKKPDKDGWIHVGKISWDLNNDTSAKSKD